MNIANFECTTKNGLYVRSNPSTRQFKIKDIIHLGRIVEVLEKRKNWIKIYTKMRVKLSKDGYLLDMQKGLIPNEWIK